MQKSQKQRLMGLGEETLAQTLINLAKDSDHAEAMLQRLIATPEEAVALLQKKLTRLKRAKRFIDWREARHFAYELGDLLDDIEANISDPYAGIKLVSKFLETDSSVFERCDDSNGSIGDIFYGARDLFVDYAKRCEDKQKVTSLLLKLSATDDYGVRADLICKVTECGVPEALMRVMIETYQQRADTEPEGYKKRHHLMLIEFLARQLKDASLFEKNTPCW